MGSVLLRLYDKIFLERPLVTVLITLAVVVFFVCHIPKFRLDASGDALVLEKDTDLQYHRDIIDRYGTSDILVLTYSVKGDLFSSASLDGLKKLRNELRQLKGIVSVITILDVPLVYSTDISLSEVADKKKYKDTGKLRC